MKICDQLSKHVAIEPIKVECEMAQLPSALVVGMVSTLEHSVQDQSKTWMTITWISVAIAVILFFGSVYMAPSANIQGMATANHSTKYNSAIG